MGMLIFPCSLPWLAPELSRLSANRFLRWQGGVEYPWSHWKTLVPLIVGIFGLIGFVLYEKYVAAEPLIPLSLFHNVTISVAYLCTVMHGIVVR